MRPSALLLLLLPLSLSASERDTLTGRVLVQNAGPQTVLAFIETGDTGVTHVLRLTAEEPFPQNPVSWQFERAHVEIEAGRFVITSAADRMSVIFAVTLPAPRPARDLVDGVRPETAAPLADLSATPEHNAILLRGHWLASRTVATGQSIATIRRSPRIAALFCDATVSGDACEDMGGTGAPGTGPGTSCNSGGPGAVSCSCTAGSTSCTVTCGSGYYACCKDCYVVNGPTCKCVKY